MRIATGSFDARIDGLIRLIGAPRFLALHPFWARTEFDAIRAGWGGAARTLCTCLNRIGLTLRFLEPAIAIVMRRFEQFQTLRQETTDLKQTLEDRKLIERAKGLLMKKAELDEAEAFRRLQKLASEQNRKLAEIARMLLTAAEAFEQPNQGRRQGGCH